MICFYCTSFLSLKHVVHIIPNIIMMAVCHNDQVQLLDILSDSVDSCRENTRILVVLKKTNKKKINKKNSGINTGISIGSSDNDKTECSWSGPLALGVQQESMQFELTEMFFCFDFFSCEAISCIGDFSIFLYALSCFDLFAYAACQCMWFFCTKLMWL